MGTKLVAGAAVMDISPRTPQSLYGYPHEPRMSTGIHDPLLSSSLYLSDGFEQTLIIANDLIYVSRYTCGRVRSRLARETGIAESHIMISATHTHSGPATIDILATAEDPAIPPCDPLYLSFAEDQMVASGLAAYASSRPAELGLAVTRAEIGPTNRHDPDGPSDPELPVLVIRDASDGHYLACLVVYSLHPTVLHEDSTLVSADFPGAMRQYLQDTIVGEDCVILYHTGPAGNQSPRYKTRSNDFASAEKLGREIGGFVADAIASVEYTRETSVSVTSASLDLVPRAMPTLEEARHRLRHAVDTLAHLREAGAAPEAVRTAECDWFGAEETMALAKATLDGRLTSAYKRCLPCEVQVLQLGPWAFVAWPGEIFVEYALQVKARHDNAFVISLANGELEGYIVTEQADQLHWYESCNAVFDYRNGQSIVDATLDLLARLDGAREESSSKRREGAVVDNQAI